MSRDTPNHLPVSRGGFWPFACALAGTALLTASLPAEAATGPKLLLPLPASDARPSLQSRCTGAESFVAPVVAVDFGASEPMSSDAVERLTRELTGLPAGTSVLLHLRIRAPKSGTDATGLEARLEQTIEHVVRSLPLGQSIVQGAILDIEDVPVNSAVLQFALAGLVLRLKTAHAALRVTVVFPAGQLREPAAFARRVTAYADAVGLNAGPSWRREAEWASVELKKPLVMKATPSSERAAASLAGTYLDTLLETGDTLIETVWADGADASGVTALCRAANVLADAMGPGYSTTQTTQLDVTLSSATTGLQSIAYIDRHSPSMAFLIRTQGSVASPRQLDVATKRGRFEVECRDATDGRPLQKTSGRPGSGPVSCAVDSVYALVVARSAERGDRIYESVSVTGRGALSVEDIVARWQQTRSTQLRAQENVRSTCLLTLHFEPTGMESGFDVSL